jgi:Lar family restriction alleviation protein
MKYLPCPFCGKIPHTGVRQDESLWSHDMADWYHVGCRECDITMSECDNEEELIERWNRRIILGD